MGTPDFAVPSLERLIQDGHSICAVVCKEDKPSGRGMKLTFPPVKQTAIAHEIEVLQPSTLKNGTFLSELERLNPEIIVVIAYGMILPKYILDFPKYGCINIHASLLPKYRGAAPIHWALINGETVTGITTMKMDVGIDTGDMLLFKEVPITGTTVTGELWHELSKTGAEVISETLMKIEANEIIPIKQDNEKATYAPMIDKSMARLDFTKSAAELNNLIRGLNPYPAAFTEIDGKKLKIFSAKITNDEKNTDTLTYKCGDGLYLELSEVQPEASRRMSCEEYMRGKR